MKTIACTGILLLLLSVTSFSQGVKIVAEGSNSLTVEVIPDSVGADTIKSNGQSFLRLVYRGAISEENATGSFARQFIPILIGVFS